MYFTQFGDQEKLKIIVHPIVTGSLSNYLITQRKCGKVLFILCFNTIEEGTRTEFFSSVSRLYTLL